MSYFTGRQKYTRPQAMLWSESVGTLTDVPLVTGITATANAGSNTITLTGVYTTSLLGLGQKIYQTGGSGSLPTAITVSAIIDSTHFTISSPAISAGTIVFNTTTSIYLPTTAYERGANITAATDAISPDFIILSDHGRQSINMKPNRIEQRQRMVNGRMRSYYTADKMTISTSWQMIPSRAYSSKPNFDTTTGLSALTPNTVDGGAGGSEMLDWYNTHIGSFWVYLAYDNHNNFGSDSASYQHITQYNEVMEMYISDFSYEVVKRGGSNFDMWNVSVTLEEA
jgi:hypothetical protein